MELPTLFIVEGQFDQDNPNEYEKSIINYMNQLRIVNMQHDETMREYESLLLMKQLLERKAETERQLQKILLDELARLDANYLEKERPLRDVEIKIEIEQPLNKTKFIYRQIDQSILQEPTESNEGSFAIRGVTNYNFDKYGMKNEKSQNDRARIEQERQAFERLQRQREIERQLELERQRQREIERQLELERQRQQQLRMQQARPN